MFRLRPPHHWEAHLDPPPYAHWPVAGEGLRSLSGGHLPGFQARTQSGGEMNPIVGEWVSVDVELPPLDEKGKPKRVLVFSEEYGRSGSSPFQFAKYIENKGGFIIDNGQGYLKNIQVPWKVTHWAKVKMP